MTTFHKFGRLTIKYNYRKTEVSQTRATRVVNKDAGPFQISVNHAVRMKVVKAICHAEHKKKPIGVRMRVDILGKLSARHMNGEHLERIGA